MLKYATAKILDAKMASGTHPALLKGAHRARFQYTPKPGFLYVRSRMISSRCNDNFDEFPAEEIAKGYMTFIGKPVFVNHHNEDHRRARGVIIEAVLHEDRNPDGSPDTWVEGLMEIDAVRFPKLAKAIVEGHIDRTSMGVDVEYSICSVCANKATTPLGYCRHIPGQKGSKHYRVAAGGQRVGSLIREKCYGLRFFENSLLVEEPADPTAFFLGEVERGPGLEHLGQRTAARTAQPLQGPPAEIELADLRMPKIAHGGACPACAGGNTISVEGSAECFDCDHVFLAGVRYPNPGDHPWFQQHPVDHQHIVDHWDKATDDEKASGQRWYADAGLVAKALGTLHQGPEHPNGNTHLAAGLIANYSPQTAWAANQHNAARALHDGHGIGGKGSGIFASGQQKTAADRMLSGEAHHDVLGGPKVRDFAHLVEHGGDAEADKPHVVIDRHALSVATGERISNSDYGAFPAQQRHYYGHVVDAYHQAAQHLSDRDHEPLAGHQVQAVTWLARQRLNQEGEKAKADAGEDSRLDRGRDQSRGNAEQGWERFKQQHLPDLKAAPGTGYAKQSHRAPKYPNPADHPVYQEYQPNPDNIVKHFDAATEGEQHQGMRWYQDAHHLAAAAGSATGMGTHVAAGLMAAYSPQMSHHAALHNAMRAMHEGEPVEPGRGAYVTRNHAVPARKILGGMHHQEALGGSKGQAMAHLIEHGGVDLDTGEHSQRVSLGSNDMAAASGMRFDDEDRKAAGKVLGNPHYYNHLAGMYHVAAQHISARDGVPVAPHQVQAVTNIVREGMDRAEDDRPDSAYVDKDRERAHHYIQERHPELGENVHVGYGEIKAPSQVDTLRDEACPVCGEQDAWNGDECKVCGFVQPPDKFQDPNVDLAKQVDLRAKDKGQLDGEDVPGLNDDVNDADGDGLDDSTGEPVDQDDAQSGVDDMQPALICPQCGTEFEAEQPQTVNTADPNAGAQGDEPAEGDLCPACGKGVLEGAADLGEPDDVNEQNDQDVDPDQNPDQEKSSSPFPSKSDDEQNDEPDDDNSDDEDDDDEGPPAKKKPFPGKR